MSDIPTSPVSFSAKDLVTNTDQYPVTAPSTQQEIEQVFGDGGHVTPPASAREEWRRYLGFLKRPYLPAIDEQTSGVRAVLRMLALDLMVMLVLIGGISLAAGLGFELPDNVNNTLEPGLLTVLLVVVLAPLAEELLFRGWLSAKPRDILACPLASLAVFMIAVALTASQDGLALAISASWGSALALSAAAIWTLLRARGEWTFFARFLPAFFWISTLAFALIHLGNYTEGSLAILLPLVLPQFALGTMLGYLRVHFGLVHAIALHAAHNALLFGLAIAGGLSEPSGAPV